MLRRGARVLSPRRAPAEWGAPGRFQVWDLGGQSSIRPYWRCYYQDTNAVVVVVDSADRERIEYSRQELDIMLQEEELKGVPVLILANK